MKSTFLLRKGKGIRPVIKKGREKQERAGKRKKIDLALRGKKN